MTEPELDAALPPPVAVRPALTCVELHVEDQPIQVDFALPVSLAVVDVFLLLDATGSMMDEIENVRAGLASFVVPRVATEIKDAAFGLALLGEFPVEPHAGPRVRPYEMRATVTHDVARIATALQHIPAWGNRDEPEAQVEALYQVATGEGLEPYIQPAPGCPYGGTGGACFRDDALPVVLLITDAPFHNGPPHVHPVRPYVFEHPPHPHSYEETVEVLKERGILVLGLGARDVFQHSPMPHLTALARDTGAVGRAPLAFDIGHAGADIGQRIVDAIKRLAGDVPLDVDAVLSDAVGDGLDGLEVVRSVRAVAASPTTGVREMSEHAFFGVRPGTKVTFEVRVDTSGLPPSSATRRYRAVVTIRAQGRSRLATHELEIVVPGRDNGHCK